MPFKPNIDPNAKHGLRIKLLKMHDDPRPVDSDMEGTINYIDSMGTIHVTWDDGRSLGVIPGVDEYLLYPPADQQITDIDSMFESDASVINRSMPKPTLSGSKSTKAGKNVTKNWKSSLSKSRVRDIKVEDEIKGGKADKLTPSEIAKKHGVSLKDIQKEIEIGIKIEMEHTDDSVLAREITLDHLVEFPDYYSNKKYGLKASEKKLEKEKEDVEETTMASGGVSTGAFMGPLTKKESRIIKFKDLIKEVNTKESGLRDGGSFDGNAWVGDKDGDGWNFNDKPIWKGGEIIDILAKKNINWKDDDLSINETTKTSNDRTTGIDPLVGHAWADKDKDGWYFDDIPTWDGGEIVDIMADVETDWTDINLSINEGEGSIHTKKWDRCVKKVKKNSPDVDPYAVCTDSIGYEGSVKKDHRRKGESVNEAAYDDPIKKKAEDRYKNHKTVSILGIGEPYESIEVIPKGKYTIREGDQEGRYFIPRFNVILLKPMKPFDLAVQLAQETGWISPFNYLEMEMGHTSEAKKTISFPLAPTLFDEPLNEGVSIRVGDPVMYKNTKSIFKRIGKPGETAHIEWNDEEIEVPIKQLHPVEELDETTTFGSVWGSSGPPVTPYFAAEKGKHGPSKKPIFKGGKIIQKVKSDGVLNENKWIVISEDHGRSYSIDSLYDVIKDELISDKDMLEKFGAIMNSPIGAVEDFESQHHMDDYGDTDGITFESGNLGSKGGHGIVGLMILPKLKDMGIITGELSDPNELAVLNRISKLLYNDIKPTQFRMAEVNKIKWVSGGKFVKIKDKCAKYNNQPWCDAGNASNPLELSDTTFQNVSEISKKLGIPESVIIERIKLKLQSNK